MKRTLILAIALTIMIPAIATPDTITLKAGYYFPTAHGGLDSLWKIEFDQMSFKKSNMKASILGASYEYFLSKELSLEISVDTYNKTKAGFYRDYVGYQFDEGNFAFPASDYKNGDFDVAHNLSVRLTPVQLSLKVLPLGRRGRFIPYVGGGVGLYFWSVGLRGEMIDFTDQWIYSDPQLGDVTIYKINQADTFEGGRMNIGYQAFGGLMFPIGNRITLNGEFRYNFIKGKFKSDSAFAGFEDFDLSGYALTFGLNYWF
jgi:opacity protein-like surface antigen